MVQRARAHALGMGAMGSILAWHGYPMWLKIRQGINSQTKM